MTTCLLALFRIADRLAHLCIGALALACVVAQGKKVEVKRNLVYATKDNLDLQLDAYLPAGKGPFPSVVVIHGGGWMSGSKRQLGRWAAELAKKQINAFAISYRLAPKFKHPAQLEDCRDAVRWIRKKSAEFNTDPSRIGALGYSAGAHLACMLAVTGMDAKDDPEGIGTDVLAAVGKEKWCASALEFKAVAPLHYAVLFQDKTALEAHSRQRRRQLVEALLEHGADRSLRCGNKSSPAQIAALRGASDILALLAPEVRPPAKRPQSAPARHSAKNGFGGQKPSWAEVQATLNDFLSEALGAQVAVLRDLFVQR